MLSVLLLIVFVILILFLIDFVYYTWFYKNPDKIIQTKKRLRFNIVVVICLFLEIMLDLSSFFTWIAIILSSFVIILDILVLIANKEKPSNDYKEIHPMRFRFHIVVINIVVMLINIVEKNEEDPDEKLVEQKENDEND